MLPRGFHSCTSHPLSFLQQLGKRLPFISRAEPGWRIQLAQGLPSACRQSASVFHGCIARITPGVVLGVPSIAVLPLQGGRTKLLIGSCLAPSTFSGLPIRLQRWTCNIRKESNLSRNQHPRSSINNHNIHNIHSFRGRRMSAMPAISPLCTAASDHPDPTKGLVPRASHSLTGFR